MPIIPVSRTLDRPGVGTFDLGDSKEERVNRAWMIGYALRAYAGPVPLHEQALCQCPFCQVKRQEQ